MTQIVCTAIDCNCEAKHEFPTRDRKWFVDFIEKNAESKLNIIRKKNADYANDGDPFQNFGLFAYVFKNVDMSKCDLTAVGIILRKLDKIQRMANLLSRPAEVAGESLEDTINDDANYDDILLAYLTSKR